VELFTIINNHGNFPNFRRIVLMFLEQVITVAFHLNSLNLNP
jgi:hypothetical protein